MTPAPRLHVTGASCAGVTTLGRRLAERLAVPHLDVDDYFWMPTDPPFTTKRRPEDRVRLIAQERRAGGWVLSGSLMDWGDALVDGASLVVFVHTPTLLRLQRLDTRERERFGTRIDPGGDMHEIHVAFRDWASHYDDPAFSGRSRARHEAWLGRRREPVLRVDGREDLEALVARVLAAPVLAALV
ncbi:adenylate kinase [uncultured Alsobacter sp.]|uniref:adenylate kinase n=1 Tax=uncultured Alsobacter sp. TaxID=1748258 RepID=UPI0025FA95BE|nr:adenylate kinase [uncultured Alsobacter sp.]